MRMILPAAVGAAKALPPAKSDATPAALSILDLVKGFVTPQLSRYIHSIKILFKLIRTHIAKVWVKAFAVIEHGNIFQYVLLCLVSCLVVSPLNTFLFQTAEETFNNSIIPAITLATHATQYSNDLEQSPERLAGILAATVRMMNQPGLWFPAPDSNIQCITDQLCLHRILFSFLSHFITSVKSNYA